MINRDLCCGVTDVDSFLIKVIAIYEGCILLEKTDPHIDHALSFLRHTLQYASRTMEKLEILGDFTRVLQAVENREIGFDSAT